MFLSVKITELCFSGCSTDILVAIMVTSQDVGCLIYGHSIYPIESLRSDQYQLAFR